MFLEPATTAALITGGATVLSAIFGSNDPEPSYDKKYNQWLMKQGEEQAAKENFLWDVYIGKNPNLTEYTPVRVQEGEDIPKVAVGGEPVYDAQGNPVMESGFDVSEGSSYVGEDRPVLHTKGEPLTGANGEPVYYNTGDVIMDENGEPKMTSFDTASSYFMRDDNGDLVLDKDGQPIEDIRVSGLDADQKRIEANYELIDPQKNLQLKQIEATEKLIEPATDLTLDQMAAQKKLIEPATTLALATLDAQLGLLPLETASARISLEEAMKQAPIETASMRADLGLTVARTGEVEANTLGIEARTEMTEAETKFIEGAKTTHALAQAGLFGAQAGQARAQTGILKEQLETTKELRPGQKEVYKEYLEAARNTPSEEELKGRATADVTQAVSQQQAGIRNQFGAARVSAAGGRYTGALADVASAGVKALAQQRTNAGIQARDEKRTSLAKAATAGLGKLG